MLLSELVAKAQEILQQKGDVYVYVGDMEEPRLELNETVDQEDVELYGESYLTIEGR